MQPVMKSGAIDSRDIAEMIGKDHNNLLKSIRKYLEYLARVNMAHRGRWWVVGR